LLQERRKPVRAGGCPSIYASIVIFDVIVNNGQMFYFAYFYLQCVPIGGHKAPVDRDNNSATVNK
jgi:hypothetical protein